MLQVYNTLSRQKEAFEPLVDRQVRMYVCGITVYDYCHIGHARMLVAFDVIARWLRACDYQLTYVRNITDIDDKILARAQEKGIPYSELTEKFIACMHEDERALGIQPPDIEPRATDYVEQMKNLIQQLIDNGAAYSVENGDVYFAVDSFPGYGKLSGKRPDELLEGARVAVGELKKDPRDFALWKGAREDEPDDAQFEAPWGRGRPGWHIECSVMSTCNLGKSFDIHGGGQDLVFPHHENEIAQSEAASHQHYAKYWLHNNAVRVDDEKMSKSLGNFFTIRDVLQVYEAEVVRYLLLASHYRSPINYSDEALDNARHALERLYLALQGVEVAGGDQSGSNTDAAEAKERFSAAMNDDFNTPEALAVMFDLARRLNTAKAAGESVLASILGSVLYELGGWLGILQRNPTEALQSKHSAGSGLGAEEIEVLVAARTAAKNSGDYPEADRIREQLSENGIVLEDSREGTRWRRK